MNTTVTVSIAIMAAFAAIAFIVIAFGVAMGDNSINHKNNKEGTL